VDALALALAAIIGLTLGLLGGGGSILTVPVFVYVLGIAPKPAIAMSLAVVGTTSLVGAAGHWRAGNVNLRVAAVFGLMAMLGTFLGARLATLLDGRTQLALFAVVMLVAAAFMLRNAGGRGPPDENPPARGPLLVVPAAIAVGVMTGLVGVGGGFLIVPALVVLARVPMKQAVGTSLLVIALNAATGFAGYLGQVEVRWAFMAGFALVASAAALGGAWLVRFVSQRALKRAFAVFLLAMGTFILWQNRDVLNAPAVAADDGAAATR